MSLVTLKLRIKANIALCRTPAREKKLLKAVQRCFGAIDQRGCHRAIIDTSASCSGGSYYERDCLLNGSGPKDATKKMGPLFILASGPSINSFSAAEWAHVGARDSWGMNLWPCHEFVPSVYYPQVFPSPVSEAWDQAMLSGLIAHKENLGDSLFEIRGDWIARRTVQNSQSGKYLIDNYAAKTSVLRELAFPENFKAEPESLLEFLMDNGMFGEASGRENLVPKYGNTLMLMVVRAMQKGFREIVLCGVEMDTNAHFFDEEPYASRYPTLRTLSQYYLSQEQPIFNNPAQRYNRTKVLEHFGRFVAEHFSVKLFIAKDTGLLKDVFPVYSFDD